MILFQQTSNQLSVVDGDIVLCDEIAFIPDEFIKVSVFIVLNPKIF